MVDAKQATITQLNDWTRDAPFCQCEDGKPENEKIEKVAYMCCVETCPSYEKQRLYCLNCLHGNTQHNHFHKVDKIKDQFDITSKKLYDLKENIDRVTHCSLELFKEHHGLIAFLENIVVPRVPLDYKPITQEIKDLEKLRQMGDTIASIIDDLHKEKKVQQFFDAFKQTEAIRAQFDQLKYLERISEDLLLHNFSQLWPRDFKTSSLSEQEEVIIKRMKARAIAVPQEGQAQLYSFEESLVMQLQQTNDRLRHQENLVQALQT